MTTMFKLLEEHRKCERRWMFELPISKGVGKGFSVEFRKNRWIRQTGEEQFDTITSEGERWRSHSSTNNNNALIVDDLSFKIEAEKSLAIATPGSGKSTILRLLYRLYDVNYNCEHNNHDSTVRRIHRR